MTVITFRPEDLKNVAIFIPELLRKLQFSFPKFSSRKKQKSQPYGQKLHKSIATKSCDKKNLGQILQLAHTSMTKSAIFFSLVFLRTSTFPIDGVFYTYFEVAIIISRIITIKTKLIYLFE